MVGITLIIGTTQPIIIARYQQKNKDWSVEIMIRVLHFVSTPATWSGVMSVIMNYYRHIDRKKIQFDFLCFNKCTESYAPEITRLGGRLFWISKPYGSPKSWAEMAHFFRDHANDYTWFHNHEVYLSFLLKPLAAHYGIQNFIVHSHATRFSDRPLAAMRNRILCFPIRFLNCYRFACSRAAGEFLFCPQQTGRSFYLLPNAIDRKRFSFNSSIRRQVRETLSLNDAFVVGHIGRFVPQKNHRFLIQVFHKVAADIPAARLLLIGDGPLRNEIQDMVHNRGLEQKVIFLGQRTDIPDLLQAMDLFVLPSIYEGLPVSCLEAQTSGLPCLVADSVSRETAYGSNFHFLPLNDDTAWCQAVIQQSKKTVQVSTDDSSRTAPISRPCPSSLPDIQKEARKLTDFYEMRSTDFESIL